MSAANQGYELRPEDQRSNDDGADCGEKHRAGRHVLGLSGNRVEPRRGTRTEFQWRDNIKGRLCSKPRCHGRHGFRRRHNGDNFEVGDVVPVCDPLIEQPAVGALHYLETAAHVVGDPTAPVLYPLRHQTSPVSKAPVHGHWIAAAICLDDHVQHVSVLSRRPRQRYFSLSRSLFRLSSLDVRTEEREPLTCGRDLLKNGQLIH